MSRKVRIILAAGLVSITAGFLAIPMFVVTAAIGFFGSSCAPSVSSATSSSTTVSEAYFNQFEAPVKANKEVLAAMFITIGRERGFSDQSIAIAIATAIQESNLTNLPYLGEENDHNSLGILQQQPSKEWGTAEEIQDPIHAINAFYDALEKIPDRDSRPMMEVAIEVQNPSVEAYESRWAWDDIAKEIVAQNAGPLTHCASRSVSGAWQVPLDPGTYTITDPYGMRLHPIKRIWKLHDGIDLGADEGTPIYAVASGVISFVGDNDDGYGNYVSIEHPGSILTGYGHLKGFATGVQEGASVSAGQLIGYVGSTGDSTGFHLHFLVHVDGKSVDPTGFMASVGVSIESGVIG